MNDLKDELRQAIVDNADKANDPGAGRTVVLVAILVLGAAIASWPFVKTLIPAPQPARSSLYYKVPADTAIVPAALEEQSIDVLFFTGCVHQRRVNHSPFINI